MYDLADFIPFDGTVLSGEHVVLTWNKKDGYYFTQIGFLMPNAKIIAKQA